MTAVLTTPTAPRRTVLANRVSSYFMLPARIGSYATLRVEITVEVPLKGTRNLFDKVKLSSKGRTVKLIHVKKKGEFWLWHPTDLSPQRLPTRFMWSELPPYFTRIVRNQHDFRRQLPRKERKEPIRLSMHLTQLTGLPPISAE